VGRAEPQLRETERGGSSSDPPSTNYPTATTSSPISLLLDLNSRQAGFVEGHAQRLLSRCPASSPDLASSGAIAVGGWGGTPRRRKRRGGDGGGRDGTESGWGGAVTGSGCWAADSTGISMDSAPLCAGRSEMDRGEEEEKGGHRTG